MNTLLLYDSFFGNTERIALAIGAALQSTGVVTTLPVARLTLDRVRGIDTLIVGSPTRGFRPTPAITKSLKSFTKDNLNGIRVAAFDTRVMLDTINSSLLRFLVDRGGYAADTIAKSLQRKGGSLVVAPEGFLVTGEKGPLKDGEIERASLWASRMATTSI